MFKREFFYQLGIARLFEFFLTFKKFSYKPFILISQIPQVKGHDVTKRPHITGSPGR